MRKKSAIALLLIVLMVALSACSQGSNSPAATDPASTPKATDENKADDQKDKEREKVTISILQGYEELRPVDYDDATERGKEQLDDIRYLVDGYEIDIDLQIYDDEYAQLPLLLASNDLPDIVPIQGLNFAEFYESGAFLPLNDLVDKYGANIKKITYPKTWDYVTRNGEICAIPSQNSDYKAQTVIRTDWLKNVGIEYKSHYTVSEFKDILDAFTNKDPDGNGQKDTYGLGARPNGGDWRWSFMAIMGAFGGQPDQYYERNGEVVYWNATDEFRQAVAYCAELYQKGLVDPEVFVLNYEQAMLKMVNGKAGVATGWWNIVQAFYDNGFDDLNPDGSWDWIYLTSDDGTKQGIQSNGIVRRTTMISADSQYPELAMQILDYIASEKNISDLDGYVLDENGHYKYKEGTEPHYKNRITTYKKWWEYTGPNGEEPKDDKEAFQYGYRALPIQYVIQTNYYQEAELKASELESPTLETDKRGYYASIAEKKEANVEGHPVYESMFYGYPNTAEDLEYSDGLNTLYTDWFVAFCTGEKPLDDANWAKYLADLNAKGAQKVLDSYVKLYNEMNGTNLVPMKIGQ